MAKISEIMQNFIMSNPNRAIWFMKTMKANFWEKKGRKMALEVFQEAAEKVPAYKDFLEKQGIDPSTIKTLEDFQEKIPVMTKENYFSQYPFADLSQGEIKKDSFGICFTSGTTGSPAAMLTSKKSLSIVINGVMSFFHYLWEIRSPSKYTLYISGFALGPWLASFLSNFVLAKEAERHNFTLTTPGSDPIMIAEILERIGNNYDQIIISGYPTVLKAFLDEGDKRKINWEEFDIKILSAGEPLPRNLKEYILNKIDPQRKNPWRILDFFATTDASVLGFGTPLATVIHQILNENEEFCSDIFELKKIPSLFQYNPTAVFVEEIEDNLAVTKLGVIPLIRYQIGDLGKAISFSKMMELLEKKDYDIKNLLEKADWQKGYFQWPFFAYLGRADDMVIIYSGAKVYARNLFNLLERPETKDIRNFKLTTETDANYNVRLFVYLELKPDLRFLSEDLINMEEKYLKFTHEELLKTNIDYKDAYRLNSQLTIPIIKIFPCGQGPFEKDKFKPKPKMVI